MSMRRAGEEQEKSRRRVGGELEAGTRWGEGRMGRWPRLPGGRQQPSRILTRWVQRTILYYWGLALWGKYLPLAPGGQH